MEKEKIEIIAEIGSVHDGSFGNACRLIELASECGATTVKFQTHISDAETTRSAPSPSYFSSENRFDYFKRTAFSESQWKSLKNRTEDLGLGFLSSPFSLEAVDLLENIGVSAFKIPSGEVTNLPLLEKLAVLERKVWISSGMSDWNELDSAVELLKSGRCETGVMQCTSLYPCPPQKVGFNIIQEMKSRYGIPVGFSDHTSEIYAAIASVCLGVAAIEKHLTFSKKMYGSDAANSLEPDQFLSMTRGIREVEHIVSNPVDKSDMTQFAEMKDVFQKSIVAARDLKVGERISLDDLSFKKPGIGVSAAEYKDFLGRRLKASKKEDEFIYFEDLEGDE
ncbi:MAG: N-acetylneuraminate synthase family protein [Opitutales bacterium]|nr:N-acetylneuraminate synthase family protein [Opitutales bacterium]